MRAWYGILPVGLILWLVACGAPNIPPPSRAAETAVAATATVTTPTTELPTRVPVPTRNATPDTTQPVTLTLWVPEEFATGAERGGDILERQIAEFQTAHPNVTLDYVLKAPYGKGGLMDWLMQLDELMPDRLPDAVIVDSRELDQLEKLGLLQPLNRDLPSGAFWDLFSPAQKIARRGGVWNNQPLTLDTEHLIYDTRRIVVPPVTWQGVLTDTTPIAFAANSTEAFLFQYMEQGGSLDPQQQPELDASLMRNVLEYYQRARANNVLNENTAVMKSAREVMPLFSSGQVPMAQVRARDFLLEQERLPNARAAAIPTRDGRATTLVSGWSFVVLSEDAAQRRAAMDYLGWMIDPARMGEWAAAARMIPASQSAYAQAMGVPVSDELTYADVMRSLLQAGLVAPSFARQAVYGKAWQDAVQAVLTGQLSPDDAAFRAVQAITQ